MLLGLEGPSISSFENPKVLLPVKQPRTLQNLNYSHGRTVPAVCMSASEANNIHTHQVFSPEKTCKRSSRESWSSARPCTQEEAHW